ncbi:MAG: hypothetical protein NTW21_33665 [Verrucomicrobia bacterium]|nr:hypothetical protein [Verrucomicrobiota bacterium]
MPKVWDGYWGRTRGTPEDDIPFVEENAIIRSADPERGIGADDRAGLAILWLLRELGHSLMVTDLEEPGRLGSTRLREYEPEILAQINCDHAFAIQFDRRNSGDFKSWPEGLTVKGNLYLPSMPGRFVPLEVSLREVAAAGVTNDLCLVSDEEIARRSPGYLAAIQRGDLPFKLWLAI